jgi:hypothetical protein
LSEKKQLEHMVLGKVTTKVVNKKDSPLSTNKLTNESKKESLYEPTSNEK